MVIKAIKVKFGQPLSEQNDLEKGILPFKVFRCISRFKNPPFSYYHIALEIDQYDSGKIEKMVLHTEATFDYLVYRPFFQLPIPSLSLIRGSTLIINDTMNMI